MTAKPMKIEGVEVSASCDTLKGFKKTMAKNEFRGECECGLEIAVGEQEIIGAGHGETATGRSLIPPFQSVKKYQEEAERAAERLSGPKDFIHYQRDKAVLGRQRRSTSEMVMASSASTSTQVECLRCGRKHHVTLRFEATVEFPLEELDPLAIWRKRGFNFEDEETKHLVERFAFNAGFGTGQGFVEALRGWEKKLKEIDGPLGRLSEAFKELEAVGVPTPAMADLGTAVRIVEERAKKSIEWTMRNWLFKLSESIETRLAGVAPGGHSLLREPGWETPAWLHEGIFGITTPRQPEPPESPGETSVEHWLRTHKR